MCRQVCQEEFKVIAIFAHTVKRQMPFIAIACIISWLTIIAVMCAFRVDALIITFAATLVGAVAMNVAFRRLSFMGYRRINIVAIGLMIVALSILLPRSYYWVTWNPVADSYDNGWGKSFFPDTVKQISLSTSADGKIATVRCVFGTFSFDESPVPFYVFLQGPGEPASANNLIFRYFATSDGWNKPPNLTWIRKSILVITTERGTVLQVTKRLRRLGPTIVLYRIADTALPDATEFWERRLF
jgi:hypothetical protein